MSDSSITRKQTLRKRKETEIVSKKVSTSGSTSRKEDWSEESIVQFHSLLEQSPCIWNKSDENHLNPPIREKAFENIADELCVTIDEVKKKYKNHRDQFMRCCRGKNPNGSPPKGKHCETLMFMVREVNNVKIEKDQSKDEQDILLENVNEIADNFSTQSPKKRNIEYVDASEPKNGAVKTLNLSLSDLRRRRREESERRRPGQHPLTDIFEILRGYYDCIRTNENATKKFESDLMAAISNNILYVASQNKQTIEYEIDYLDEDVDFEYANLDE